MLEANFILAMLSLPTVSSPSLRPAAVISKHLMQSSLPEKTKK